MSELPAEDQPEQAVEPVSFATTYYLHLRKISGFRTSSKKRKKLRATGSEPFSTGRDPFGIDRVLGELVSDLGWSEPLSEGELTESWREVVGDKTAQHSKPVKLVDGVLTVKCDSTAWATQLRLLRDQLLSHIAERFPAARVDTIRFLGPDVPSFKRGPRTVQGRGPRDTYG